MADKGQSDSSIHLVTPSAHRSDILRLPKASQKSGQSLTDPSDRSVRLRGALRKQRQTDIVRADDMLTAFVELKKVIHGFAVILIA